MILFLYLHSLTQASTEACLILLKKIVLLLIEIKFEIGIL